MNTSTTSLSISLPEILAPAGSEESFAAALASGADAVYLGLADGFNARRRSTAFRVEELETVVRRAREAGTRVYVTLNTLVFESELVELERIIAKIAQSGVYALIVQDPATAFIARKIAPKIRLHASTQMTISSPEGAEFAAGLGMTRIVVPRELSAREIALFAKASSIELEVFVHGALCMAWSGQCLTSEAFSERSANRGQCSQACRMPYEAIVDGEKRELGDQRYLLSPQDLAAHEILPELMEIGVASLKIEGRYKGAAYVTSAVDSWRAWREAVGLGKDFRGDDRLKSARERAQLTYTRGASLGFLEGDNHQELVVGTTPKHRGLPLGVVKSVRRREVTVLVHEGTDTHNLLRPGMGIKFELVGRSDAEHDPENAPGGPLFRVEHGANQMLLAFGEPGPNLTHVRPGDLVRLTGDPEVGREAMRRLAKAPRGRLAVTLHVSGRQGTPLVVIAEARTFHGTIDCRFESSLLLETAQKGGGLTAAILEEKLGALGDTPFSLTSCVVENLEAGLFLPVSELKRIRRVIVSELLSALHHTTTEPTQAVEPVSFVDALRASLAENNLADEGPAQVVPLFRTEEQLEAWIASGAKPGEEVELDWMEMVGLTRAVRRAREAGLRVALATVRVQKPGEEVYDRRVANLQPDAVLVRHWGGLMHFSKRQKQNVDTQPAFQVHGDFSLNVTNSLTAHHLLGLGLSTVTASHDLNRDQVLSLLQNVPRGRIAIPLHHHIPTFHNSHCVYAHLLSNGKDYRDCGRPCDEHRVALRDYAGHEHAMVVDVSCRNTMFNALAGSAAPLVPRLLELGVRRFRVEFVWESGAEVVRTLSAYRRLLAGEITPAAALKEAAVHERYGVTTLRRGKTSS